MVSPTWLMRNGPTGGTYSGPYTYRHRAPRAVNVEPGGEFVGRAVGLPSASLDRSTCVPTYPVTEGLVAIVSQRGPCLRKVCPQKGRELLMTEQRINRRLAAILAADVVGYSRLMGADEAGTLAALKRHREAVFDPAVAAHNGRIVKLIGDGVIAEFGSVVDAVNCALSVQRSSARTPDQSASQPAIVLRIGINLGDVIIEGDDIYGDGVNIAARLEPLAEPGGICVSSIVNESVGNRIDVRFQDSGEISVKNIDRPIRVWKWHPSTTTPTAARSNAAKPEASVAAASIAVLPFTNMSGDPEQEYFSDGVSEDIITDLSKIAGLTVIARNSSFTYKGRSVDVRTIGRDLGVRSVLEGSIRRAGNRVRITAQLIDAATGAHLWADRYDRDLTDIFEVQDEVVEKIVGVLAVTLTQGEQQRLRRHGTNNVEAYEYWLRARALAHSRYAGFDCPSSSDVPPRDRVRSKICRSACGPGACRDCRLRQRLGA